MPKSEFIKNVPPVSTQCTVGMKVPFLMNLPPGFVLYATIAIVLF